MGFVLGVVFTVVVGTISSIIAGLVLDHRRHIDRTSVPRRREALLLLRRLRANRIHDVYFGRAELSKRSFWDLFASASDSIEIIAYSLRGTDPEDLTDALRTQLVGKPHLRVHISLLEPDSMATRIVAASYRISPEQIARDVEFVRQKLESFRSNLDASVVQRFHLSYHRRPEASAVLIDCLASSGPVKARSMIQVEHKMYALPRGCSFGYLVYEGSEFFEHNLRSWRTVLQEAETVW